MHLMYESSYTCRIEDFLSLGFADPFDVAQGLLRRVGYTLHCVHTCVLELLDVRRTNPSGLRRSFCRPASREKNAEPPIDPPASDHPALPPDTPHVPPHPGRSVFRIRQIFGPGYRGEQGRDLVSFLHHCHRAA